MHEKPYVSTGFSALDKQIVGLHNGDLILIGGRPAMGKTGMATDIAMHLANSSRKTTLYFSMEMSVRQFIDCLHRKGSLLPITGGRLQLISDPKMTLEKMKEICEETENLGAVIVDDVQLLYEDDADAKATHEQPFRPVSPKISHGLQRLAKELDVPVICLSRISRDCENRENKRPGLQDCSRISCLTAAADLVLLLYRDRYYDPFSSVGELAECIIARNRYGSLGTVKLQWEPERMRFSDWKD